MIKHSFSAVAAAAVVLGAGAGAGAASAQGIDFDSPENRVWWNGVTPNELQELAEEAGATYTAISQSGSVAESRLNFPLIGEVRAKQSGCRSASGQVDRDANCGGLLLIYTPTDPSVATAAEGYWLGSGRSDGRPVLFRQEFYNLGTTRGGVLGDLVIFHTFVARQLGIEDAFGILD